MSSDLPAPSSITSLPQEQQFRVLDTLFESSPELHTLMAPVLANQAFSSYSTLIDAVGGRMSALSAANSSKDRDILVGILGSHPRLGQPKGAPTEHLSELSKKEQANLNTGAEEQAEKLKRMNAEYEEKFPGLRFVYVPHHPMTFVGLTYFRGIVLLSTAATGMSSWKRCGRGSTGVTPIAKWRRLYR